MCRIKKSRAYESCFSAGLLIDKRKSPKHALRMFSELRCFIYKVELMKVFLWFTLLMRVNPWGMSNVLWAQMLQLQSGTHESFMPGPFYWWEAWPIFSELKCFKYKVKIKKVLFLVYFIDERKSLRHVPCSLSSNASYAK